MAKTIKFNLIMDGNVSVRNIEGLQEAFCIEDLLKYFKNGLLERWLKTRGLVELDKVKSIDKNEDDISIAKQLIKIFDIESDDKAIEEELAILRYSEQEKEQLELYEKSKHKRELVIKDYMDDYNALIKNICSHKDNWLQLKADVTELQSKYSALVMLLHDKLFAQLKDEAPMSIIVMLVNDKESMFRKLWLQESGYDSDNAEAYKIKSEIDNMLKPSRLREILGDKLIRACKNTNGNWRDEKDKDVAVLNITAKELVVRNWDKRGEELGKDEVNGNLPLLKGLQFQCSSDTAQLYYVEV